MSAEEYIVEVITEAYNNLVDANEVAIRAENRMDNAAFDEYAELLPLVNARQLDVFAALKSLRIRCENSRDEISKSYGYTKPDAVETMDGELRYIINICQTVISDRNLSKDFSHIDKSTMDKLSQAIEKIEQLSKQAPAKHEDVKQETKPEMRVESKPENRQTDQPSESIRLEAQRAETYRSYDNGEINKQISAHIDFLVKHKEPEPNDQNYEGFLSLMRDLAVLAREGRAKLLKNYDVSDPKVEALLESYDRLEAYPFAPKGKEMLIQVGQDIQERYSKLNEREIEQNQEQAVDIPPKEQAEEVEQTEGTKKFNQAQSNGAKKASYTKKDFYEETGISVTKLQHLGFSKDELRYVLAQTNKKEALMPLLSKKIESGEISISDLPRYNAITGEENDWGLLKKSGESIAKEAIQSLKDPTKITRVEGELMDLEKSKSPQNQAQAPEV